MFASQMFLLSTSLWFCIYLMAVPLNVSRFVFLLTKCLESFYRIFIKKIKLYKVQVLPWQSFVQCELGLNSSIVFFSSYCFQYTWKSYVKLLLSENFQPAFASTDLIIDIIDVISWQNIVGK